MALTIPSRGQPTASMACAGCQGWCRLRLPLMSNVRRLYMSPPAGYVGTAALLAFAVAALAAYPSAAVLSEPGVAPNTELWFAITAGLGLVLTAYSAAPKSSLMLQFNWLVVPMVCLLVAAVCWLFNPKAVQDNAAMVFLFSIFTLGAPFWLPLLGLLLHARSCSKISR